ncbi:MAG: tRNA uridine-5-carboxymethylaminomethyl(34) synthesis GTPase MnmE [Candidatus Dasytiphilus stammeri]
MNHITSFTTIVAQATPPGRGGVSIIRVSGDKSAKVAKFILKKLPVPRYAEYLSFHDYNTGNIIDKGITIWFPAPNSFTGEDVLELHTHGSPVVVDMIINIIANIPGVRIANPGEFSERAFINNKIDLVQAEAIIDLINASSEQAARAALNSLQGIFSFHIGKLVQKINKLRVEIEAAIDFSIEQSHNLSINNLIKQLNDIIKIITDIYYHAQQGSLIQESKKIVIIGNPNVGKSSIFNALTRKNTAIVSEFVGTTRDVLHEYINIDGIIFHIIDTAGIHNTTNIIEKIGIERTLQEIKNADHILYIVDTSFSKEKIKSSIMRHNIPYSQLTIVRNKIDLKGETSKITKIGDYIMINISAQTEDGINILRKHIKHNFIMSNTLEGLFLARRRHLKLLEIAKKHLQKCKNIIINRNYFELLAEELRLTQKTLSKITGKDSEENLLGEIFNTFCIGK